MKRGASISFILAKTILLLHRIYAHQKRIFDASRRAARAGVEDMKNHRWKETVELLGIVAIVASLVFVGLQMRQDHQIAYAEAFTNILSNKTEMVDLVNSNREIWQKGNAGAELSPQDNDNYRDLVEPTTSAR